MRLPTLYKEDSKDKKRYWKISCHGDTITVRYGIVDGKEIVSSKATTAKNLGRANETTAEGQAKLECERDWTKKLDGGYKPDEDDEDGMKRYTRVMKVKNKDEGCNLNASKSVSKKGKEEVSSKSRTKSKGNKDNHTISDCRIINPMLAPSDLWKDLPRQRKHLNFEEGVYVQPKLDGTRAVCFLVEENDETKVAITSRTGKQYPWLLHLRKELLTFLKEFPDVVLDGELYVHTAYDEEGNEKSQEAKFQFLQEMNKPRRGTAHALESQLEYHVFDIVDPDSVQKKRFRTLKKLFDQEDVAEQCPHIVHVTPTLVHSNDEIEPLFDKAVEAGYEGLILRAHDCPYTTKAKQRCLKMRKMKSFDEAEFKIVGFTRDEGVDECYFCYQCETEDGEKFKAASMGTVADRKKLWVKRKKLIGKMLTVSYQGVSKDGIPRFPKGKGVRNKADDPS